LVAFAAFTTRDNEGGLKSENEEGKKKNRYVGDATTKESRVEGPKKKAFEGFYKGNQKDLKNRAPLESTCSETARNPESGLSRGEEGTRDVCATY